MKIGNKIICIRKYKLDDYIIYEKNNIYTITDIIDEFNIMSSRYVIDNYLSFYIKPQMSDWCFDDYFISLKKSRKQKLEKIKSL